MLPAAVIKPPLFASALKFPPFSGPSSSLWTWFRLVKCKIFISFVIISCSRKFILKDGTNFPNSSCSEIRNFLISKFFVCKLVFRSKLTSPSLNFRAWNWVCYSFFRKRRYRKRDQLSESSLFWCCGNMFFAQFSPDSPQKELKTFLEVLKKLRKSSFKVRGSWPKVEGDGRRSWTNLLRRFLKTFRTFGFDLGVLPSEQKE